jgi:hypothetical protein
MNFFISEPDIAVAKSKAFQAYLRSYGANFLMICSEAKSVE